MKYGRVIVNQKIRYCQIQDDCVQLIGDFFDDKKVLEEVKLNQVKLISPICPSKIICVGFNYRSHADEFNENVPEEPVLFMKPPSAIIGNGEEIVCPPSSFRIDYEAELAVVVAKKAKNVTAADANEYIFGYTIANDVTARDLQEKDDQWTRAKSFDTFLPLGPWIDTAVNPSDLKIELRLNGVLKQSSTTASLIFSVGDLFSYISQIMTLIPGDLILTGTPSGIGRMEPGDVVEVYVENIGTLKNVVKKEQV